jgi:hypothetical protein
VPDLITVSNCIPSQVLDLRNPALPWLPSIFPGLGELHLDYRDIFVSLVEEKLLPWAATNHFTRSASYDFRPLHSSSWTMIPRLWDIYWHIWIRPLLLPSRLIHMFPTGMLRSPPTIPPVIVSQESSSRILRYLRSGDTITTRGFLP